MVMNKVHYMMFASDMARRIILRNQRASGDFTEFYTITRNKPARIVCRAFSKIHPVTLQ